MLRHYGASIDDIDAMLLFSSAIAADYA